MRSYLIYDTEAEAQAVADQIYVNAIKSAIADDRFIDNEGRAVERVDARPEHRDTKDKIIDKRSGEWIDGTVLSDNELNDSSRFPLMGFRAGKLNIDYGFTLRWSTPRQVDNGTHAGKWAITEPDGQWAPFKAGINTPAAKSKSKSLFNNDVGA